MTAISRKEESNNSDLSNKGKCIIIIKSIYLSIALDYQSRLKVINFTIGPYFKGVFGLGRGFEGVDV